ncbi:hypothetical protein RHMOL_Rhmol10G0227800 [Rhododendron molle]|uniref:Uncharacterized protein n=1 Tax=Rhododendron molle TaxID=49168 RepID=A0ACC0M565_RHOML|nr:hypothetical protein RHMOL_Rhmol10G0227800 [Rhododendron molle]
MLPTSTGEHASHLHHQNPTPALPTADDRHHHWLLGSPTLLPTKQSSTLEAQGQYWGGSQPSMLETQWQGCGGQQSYTQMMNAPDDVED